MNQTTTTCPFCGLHCDDLQLDLSGTQGRSVDVQCPKAMAAYRWELATSPHARIATTEVSLEAMEAFVAERFAGRKLSVVTSGTDLQLARHLEQLVRHLRISLYIDACPGTTAWRAAIAREGMVSATLADVRMHADLVWMIGEVETNQPRMIERINGTAKTLLRTARLDSQSLANLIYEFGWHNGEQAAESASNTPSSALCKAISQSQYVAILVGTDAFESSHIPAVTEMLAKWVWRLNATRRAVVLCIDSAATNRAVAAWRSNRVIPDVSNLPASEHSFDLRIGDAKFETSPVLMQIGGQDPGVERAEAFVPAARVGIHEGGIVIRGDSTVTLRLQPISNHVIATTTQWLCKLPPNDCCGDRVDGVNRSP